MEVGNNGFNINLWTFSLGLGNLSGAIFFFCEYGYCILFMG